MAEHALKPGWTWVKFGDVVRQVKNKVDAKTSGLKRYVAGQHMVTDDLRIRRWGEINDDYLGPAFHRHFKPRQVLYGSRRTYLRKVAVADFEGICANTTFVLESKKPSIFLPELLPFIMQTEAFHEYSITQSRGSVNPYVNFSDLAKYEFALPPLEEQRRLAKLLLKSTKVIESNQLALDRAEKLLNATREHLFSDERTNLTTLGKVLTAIEAGKSLVGINEPPSFGQYAVLKVSAVGRAGFLPKESKTLVEQTKFIPKHSIKSGDLIITRANTPDLVGMTCFVEQDYPNLMLCDKTLRLISNEEIDSKLLWEALWTCRVRQQIKSIATGTGAAMKNLSQAKLRQLQIRLPSDTGCNSQVLKQMSSVRLSTALLQQHLRDAKSLYSTLSNTLLTEMI